MARRLTDNDNNSTAIPQSSTDQQAMQAINEVIIGGRSSTSEQRNVQNRREKNREATAKAS